MPDELAEAQAALDEAAAAAQQIAAEEVKIGAELEQVGGGKMNAAEMRADMEAIQRRTERATAEVERATKRVKRELERQMREQQNALAERMARVNAALAPVKKRLALMEEGIATLGLYLSAANGVRVVRDGERASELEPIVIRQMVLAMDEETGLFAEDGGITAGDVDAFGDWLCEDAEHLQQIAPEPKSVVALVARWSERESGNPWSSDPSDRVTHFLIRNGEALFLTSVNDFRAGEVLIPRSDEFVSMFKRKRYRFESGKDESYTLKPGTREYAEAMETSDAKGRHFLRIGLILQGLVDNSDVFEPLHPAGINMLVDPAEHGEKVRFITDAEGGLESGAETFPEWHKCTNSELRPGMRIVAWFKGYDSDWKRANEWTENYQPKGHSRVYPSGYNQPTPPSGVPLLIEDRRADGGLVCRFERTDEIWDRSIRRPAERPGYVYIGGHRKPKQRASVTVYPSDSFVIAYDLIESAEEMRAFLASRRNRHGYREMFPLIRAAMFAKAEEERVEAPFIDMMAGVLARENGVTVEEARADLPDLVRWFKLKNRWARPLTAETMASMEEVETSAAENERTVRGRLTMDARSARARRARRVLGGDALVQEYDEAEYEEAIEREKAEGLRGREHEALAVRAIVGEHRRRVGDRRRPVNAKVVEALRSDHQRRGDDVLAIVRPRRGGYSVLVVADANELVYVHEHDYTTKGAPREVREWRTVSADRASRWTFAWRDEELWAGWRLNARPQDYLAGPDREAFLARLRHAKADEPGEQPMMQSYLPPTAEHPGRYVTWTMTGDAIVPTYLLSGSLKSPTYVARERRFARGADGLRVLRDRWQYDDHQWEERGDLPWEGHYAKQYAYQIVWGPDAEALARWTRELERYRRASATRRELEDRASGLISSIGDQYEALAKQEAFAEFVAERDAAGDNDWPWEEWEEHWHERHPGVHASGRWGHWDCPPYHAVRFMVRWCVERGVGDWEGRTVRDAWARAEGMGLPGTFTPRHASAGEQPLTLPDDAADLVFGAEPAPEPADERGTVCAHCGERKPDEEFEDGARCKACAEEQDHGDMELEDGVSVVGPEEPEPDRDVFDDLRDALGGV